MKSDSLTENGAKELASRIMKYWAGRGFSVKAEAYRVVSPKKTSEEWWGVKSDMVGGLPRRAEKLALAA